MPATWGYAGSEAQFGAILSWGYATEARAAEFQRILSWATADRYFASNLTYKYAAYQVKDKYSVSDSG